MYVAVQTGESHTRTKNNRIEKWCGRCTYWTWADKAHETADCPNTAAANVAGAEIEAAAHVATTTSDDIPSSSTSQDESTNAPQTTGFAGLVSHAVDF